VAIALRSSRGFVWQYYFYLDREGWGRVFVRICTYFPFNSRACVNQHVRHDAPLNPSGEDGSAVGLSQQPNEAKGLQKNYASSGTPTQKKWPLTGSSEG
jgi:hypothetical protein